MKAKIYTKTTCPYCVQAKTLLNMRGVDYEEVNLETEAGARDTLLAECQKLNVVPRTVPQIWLGEQYVGGFTELKAHFDSVA